MIFSLETLAALATILGTGISILALLHARVWIVSTSILLIGLALVGGLYTRRQRLAKEAQATVVEGYSIDSLNVANLRRRLDRAFVIQEANHTAHIKGANLGITWAYSGYCRFGGASTFEFSVDSGSGTSFEELDCVAYDLERDPEMTRPIRPLLIGPEGISKKISVPLLEPLQANQPFGVLLKCTLPRCLTPGTGYYTSTLSFSQDYVRRSTVRLIFIGPAPVWMRVYECSRGQSPVLLKSLAPSHREVDLCEYVDIVENAPGRSARVYMFWRESM